jgi:Tol biopolymer transport system component
MSLAGEPIAVAQDVGSPAAGGVPSDFAAGHSGILSFVQGTSDSSALTWFDRNGEVIGTSGPEGQYTEIYLSPAGDRLLYVAADPATGNRDLWLQDLEGSAPSRFTSGPDVDHLAAFSPDGNEIVWEAHEGTDLVLMRRPADFSAPATVVREWNRGGGPTDWSPDGKHILYRSDDGPTQYNLWAVPLDGGDPVALIQSEFAHLSGRFSPEGGWLAYTSDASGRSEVYLQRLEGLQRIGGPQRVSADGGTSPRWRADGSELFFLAGTTLMAVNTSLDAALPAGAPRPLFDFGDGLRSGTYVTAPDGQAFLAIVQAGNAAAQPATVILNWRAEGGR